MANNPTQTPPPQNRGPLTPDAPSTVRFLCTHCHAPFQAPPKLKGARTFCASCKAVTFVTLEAGSKAAACQIELLARLQSPTYKWIRTTCTCGKVIKAPAAFAGKEGACPQCNKMMRIPDPKDLPQAPLGTPPAQPADQPLVSEFDLLASSENSGFIDTPFTAKSAEGYDFREIKYEPLKKTPVDPASRFDGFVRSRCLCGQRVKAPAEMGGKIGQCPKCHEPVAMPLPPVFKLVSELDAMAAGTALETMEDQVDNENSGIIELGTLVNSIDDLAPSSGPDLQPSHVPNPASPLQPIAGKTFLQRKVFFARLFFRKLFERVHACYAWLRGRVRT